MQPPHTQRGAWICPAAWQDEMAALLDRQLRECATTTVPAEIQADLFQGITDYLADGGLRAPQVERLRQVWVDAQAAALTSTGLGL